MFSVRCVFALALLCHVGECSSDLEKFKEYSNTPSKKYAIQKRINKSAMDKALVKLFIESEGNKKFFTDNVLKNLKNRKLKLKVMDKANNRHLIYNAKNIADILYEYVVFLCKKELAYRNQNPSNLNVPQQITMYGGQQPFLLKDKEPNECDTMDDLVKQLKSLNIKGKNNHPVNKLPIIEEIDEEQNEDINANMK